MTSGETKKLQSLFLGLLRILPSAYLAQETLEHVTIRNMSTVGRYSDNTMPQS
jgi:hypothetical protein